MHMKTSWDKSMYFEIEKLWSNILVVPVFSQNTQFLNFCTHKVIITPSLNKFIKLVAIILMTFEQDTTNICWPWDLLEFESSINSFTQLVTSLTHKQISQVNFSNLPYLCSMVMIINLSIQCTGLMKVTADTLLYRIPVDSIWKRGVTFVQR